VVTSEHVTSKAAVTVPPGVTLTVRELGSQTVQFAATEDLSSVTVNEYPSGSRLEPPVVV
jgi:hypothetical protein